MQTIIITLLTVNLLVLIIGFIFISKLTEIRRKKFIQSMVDRVSLENINLTDCFSKNVITLYLDVLANTNKYSLTNCTLDVSGSDIKIWASNELNNRRFYSHNTNKKEEVEKMNNKLTHLDKVLLDKICTAFKERQDKLVTKFFI